MVCKTNQTCYTDDWHRTEPDLVLYLPPRPALPTGDNEQIIVNFMPKSGDMLGPGNDGGEVGRIWLAMYGCFTQRNGKRIFWYPDRKHFLLGRYITDEILAPLTVPK